MVGMVFSLPVNVMATDPIPDGILTYWRLDEGSGDIAYDSADGHDAYLPKSPAWTTGKMGGALLYDGVDDHVLIPSTISADIGSPMAIELWFYALNYPTTQHPETYDCFIYIETHSGGYHRGIWGDNSGRLYFQPGGPYGTYWYSDIGYSLNQWNHIATNIFNYGYGIRQEVYFNGVLAATHTYSYGPMWSGAGDYMIGADNNGRHLNGMIDEVAIFNRVLSSSEIQQHYNNGAGSEITPDSNTVCLWHFNEGSGTTTMDSSNNGHHGTLMLPTASSPQWTNGLIGDALNFDGVDDYVNVPVSPYLTGGNQRTIEFWMKGNALAARQALVTKWIHGNHAEFYVHTSLYSGDEIHFHIASHRFDTGWHNGWTQDADIQNGVWYHVAAVFDGTQTGNENRMKIYVNGVQKTMIIHGTIPSTLTQTNSPVTIGGETTLSRYFNGIIDEVAIWDIALTADEVLLHYTNGLIGEDYLYVPPDQAILNLFDDIQNIDELPDGAENSLLSKLNAALEAIDNGNENAAVNLLNAFIAAVSAQSGRKLTVEEADALIAAAQDILNELNGGP
jgi:hypothetical protein